MSKYTTVFDFLQGEIQGFYEIQYTAKQALQTASIKESAQRQATAPKYKYPAWIKVVSYSSLLAKPSDFLYTSLLLL